MPSRLLTDLHPLLVQEYQRTQQLYRTTHPSAPQPFITCTYRPLAEQAALLLAFTK